MIELDSLKFVVDTTDLIKAVTEVGKLQSAVSNLNKPLKENATISAAAAKESNSLAISDSNAAKAAANAEAAVLRLNAAKERAQRASERVIKNTTQEVSVIEKLNLQLDYMAKGFTTGQSSRLASMKAQGLAVEDITKAMGIFNQMTRLKGGDPLDKSLSGTKSLKNALRELRIETELVDKGVELTSKQYKELAREKARIIQASLIEGKSYSEIKARLKKQEGVFISLARQVNNYTEAEKLRERSQRDRTNAIRSLNAEDEKMDSILRSLNVAQTEHVSVSDKAARSIANYERNLRLAGVTGEQAATKLDKYRKAAMLAAQAEEKRKVSFLSRALAPQISDVVVSLAGGMNPMTVMLQQGLQVRDLIGLSGVAAKDLQVAFKSAASDMVSSLKGTAVALSSLLVGGLKDAGASVLKFGGDITGLNFLLDKAQENMTKWGTIGTTLQSAFTGAAVALRLITGVGVLAVVSAVLALIIAFKNVIQEQTALSSALIMTGASLGFTKEEAISFANSMEGFGISQTKATAAITAFAKEGVRIESDLQNITKAAADLERVGGQSFEEIAKTVSDLGKTPTESLIKFAMQTGRVSVETLKQVQALEKSGKATEAARIAQEAFTAVTKDQAVELYNSLSPIEQVWLDIKSAIGSAWEEFKEFARGEGIAAVFKTAWQAVAVTASEVWYVLKQTGIEIGGIAAQVAALMRLDFEGFTFIGDQMKQDAAKARTDQDALVGRLLKGESAFTKNTNAARLNGAQLKKNSEDAAALQRKNKKSKSPKSDAEKEEDRLSKLSSKYLKDFTFNAINADATAGDLTKSQQDLLEVLSSPDWVKLPDKAGVLAKAYAAIGAEQINNAIKERVQLAKEEFNEYSKFLQQQEDFSKAQSELTISLKESSELLSYEASLISILPEERAKLLKIKQVEFNLSKKLLEIDKLFLKNSSDWIAERSKAMANAATEIQQINSAASNDLKDKMVTDVTEAITTGLFEGGKSGSAKLRNIIEAELQKPITIFIRAVVGDILGGSSGATASGGSSGALSSISSVLGNISAVSGALGTGLAAGFTNALTGTFAGSLSAAGSLIGTGSMAGISAGIGMGLGTLMPYIGVIAALPAIADALFGGGIVDSGIGGKFSSTGFSGYTYKTEDGGLLGNDDTYRKVMSSDMQAQLSNSFSAMKNGVIDLAKSLNLATTDIEKYTKNIEFSTVGLSKAEISEKFTTMFTNMSNSMAQKLLGSYQDFEVKVKQWTFGEGSGGGSGGSGSGGGRLTEVTKIERRWVAGEYMKLGETAIEALTRLSSSLKSVNTFLENTNDNLLEFSLKGADVASSLVELFGGVDNFNSVSGSYYQQFFSDQERLTKGQELLSNAFEDLNISMPSTVAAYRQLVESQDLTTESGRETFTALLTLSSAFYGIKTAAEEAASTIIEEVNRLRGVVQTNSLNGFEGTKSSFLSAISMAQGGDATALASLPDLSQSLETMYGSTAGSLEDVNRFRSWLANSLQGAVPTFATGGLHSGGMRIVGENGPELEMTGPSRIFSNADSMQMLSSEGVIRAIEVMNSNLEMLRAEVRADVQHNAKTAKLLDRVIPDGDSIRTSVA